MDKPTITKKAFDQEYMTQWRKEVEFLHSRNIDPVFTKTSKYGIHEYKYTKTPTLFAALVEFYATAKPKPYKPKIVEQYENISRLVEEHKLTPVLVDVTGQVITPVEDDTE